jgi:hypothetical protein
VNGAEEIDKNSQKIMSNETVLDISKEVLSKKIIVPPLPFPFSGPLQVHHVEYVILPEGNLESRRRQQV